MEKRWDGQDRMPARGDGLRERGESAPFGGVQDNSGDSFEEDAQTHRHPAPFEDLRNVLSPASAGSPQDLHNTLPVEEGRPVCEHGSLSLSERLAHLAQMTSKDFRAPLQTQSSAVLEDARGRGGGEDDAASSSLLERLNRLSGASDGKANSQRRNLEGSGRESAEGTGASSGSAFSTYGSLGWRAVRELEPSPSDHRASPREISWDSAGGEASRGWLEAVIGLADDAEGRLGPAGTRGQGCGVPAARWDSAIWSAHPAQSLATLKPEGGGASRKPDSAESGQPAVQVICGGSAANPLSDSAAASWHADGSADLEPASAALPVMASAAGAHGAPEATRSHGGGRQALIVLLVLLVCAVGIFFYQGIRTGGSELDQAIALIQESDSALVALDQAVVREVSADNVDQLPALIEYATGTEATLDEALAHVRVAQSTRWLGDSRANLSTEVAADIEARMEMLDYGTQLVQADYAAYEASEQLMTAWPLVIDADSKMREAAESVSTATWEDVEGVIADAIGELESAKDDLESATIYISAITEAMPEADTSRISAYLEAKAVAIDAAIAADNALLDSDEGEQEMALAVFEEADDAAVEAADNVGDPSAIITDAYEEVTDPLLSLYKEARAKVASSDVYIRNYLDIGDNPIASIEATSNDAEEGASTA